MKNILTVLSLVFLLSCGDSDSSTDSDASDNQEQSDKFYHVKQNLREKMLEKKGEFSAGADYWKGAKSAVMYLYIDTNRSQESSDNDFGVKVAIHEYIHILQQGYLGKQISSVSKEDSLGENRFQIKNYAAIDKIFVNKIKSAMDALPASMKILDVPTYIILIPQKVGGIGEHKIEAAIDDMMQVQFGDISVDDPMINTKYNVNANQNLAFAEGEAEYFSVNVYIPTVTKSWAKPFDGPQDWTQRISDNKEMFTSSRSSFHIGTGFNDALTKMESSGWRANPVGELTFEYFITTWCKENGVSWCKEKDVSTHNAILNLWKETETLGFSKAFENATGHRWSRFVCDMEDHYQVNGDNKCVENEKNNQGHLDPLNTL